MDLRTRAARLMKAARAELVAHVGGAPSATQAAIIEQLVQLRLRLATMDRKFAEIGEMMSHESRTYLALGNSYSRLLRQLGLKGSGEPLPADGARTRSNGHTASPADPLVGFGMHSGCHMGKGAAMPASGEHFERETAFAGQLRRALLPETS